MSMSKADFQQLMRLLLALILLTSTTAMTAYAQNPPKGEIIIGGDFDSFNFTGPAQALSLAYRSKITSDFALELDGYGAHRFGSVAGRSGLALTYSPTRRTSFTAGGSAGPSNPVAARGEGFAEFDHGFDVSETGLIRGIEVDYRQSWLWFPNSRAAVFTPGLIFYLPKDCMFLVRAYQARIDVKSPQSVSWTTSASARLMLPLSTRLTGDVFYANGAENFTLADQVGQFSAQTYGGGARYRMGQHEFGTHLYHQNRTQRRTQTTVSLSYVYRF